MSIYSVVSNESPSPKYYSYEPAWMEVSEKTLSGFLMERCLKSDYSSGRIFIFSGWTNIIDAKDNHRGPVFVDLLCINLVLIFSIKLALKDVVGNTWGNKQAN